MRRLLPFLVLCLFAITACRDRGKVFGSPRVRPSNGKPIVVIGIDGANWHVLRKLIRDGEVPTLARLMRNGAWGDLETLHPTRSPAIWTTIATGYSPEVHGITEFATHVPDTGALTLVGSTQRRVPAIWNIGTSSGVSVGVVNWWATFPAEDVRGFMVTDRANLRRRFGYQSVLHLNDRKLGRVGEGETFPPDILPKVLAVVGANSELPPAAKKFEIDPMPADLQRKVNDYQTLVRDQRLSVLKFVMLQDHAASVAAGVSIANKGTPRLLMVYFSGLDAAEHQFWAYYEPERYPHPPAAADVKALGHVIPNYYKYVDSLIEQLLHRVPSDALVVVLSDHGHHANPEWDPKAAVGDYTQWSMGNHDDAPPGIIMFAGPGVQPGYLQHASVYDITPTLLAYLGIPPSRDMPGRVINEAFTRDAQGKLNLERIDRELKVKPAGKPKPAAVDPELLEKLRSLGYIR